MELNKVEALAQFNKLNGLFTMVLGKVDDISMLNHDFYVYKEIEIDTTNETVLGTIDNFSIVNIHEQPLVVTEDSLNFYAREKIIEVYPLEKQLSIIGSILEKLSDAAGIEADDLKEMNDFISEVKRVNGLKKQFFVENPDYQYMSTEDLEAAINKKYEGAINEYGESIANI
jgi:hypothetical protein